MNRLGWVALLLAAALALAAYQGRARSARSVPADDANGSATGSATSRASGSAPANARPTGHGGQDVGGAPLTEPGTTAGIEGILAGSKTTPHVEDASQKARNAMRTMRAAEDRERAALGNGSTSPQSSRPDEP